MITSIWSMNYTLSCDWHSTGAFNRMFPFISDIHQVWKGAKDCDLHQK